MLIGPSTFYDLISFKLNTEQLSLYWVSKSVSGQFVLARRQVRSTRLICQKTLTFGYANIPAASAPATANLPFFIFSLGPSALPVAVLSATPAVEVDVRLELVLDELDVVFTAALPDHNVSSRLW